MVHIVYVMKQNRQISMESLREREREENGGTKYNLYYLKTSNNYKSVTKIGYMLTNLGQIPFMLLTTIA